jgi:aspartyl-tRNA(Asn)/glutamyl-tRNA(Gln) amidotransferase subunit A
VNRPDQLDLLTLAEAGRMIRDGSLDSVTYVEFLIERIQRLDPMLRCTITLAAETALEAAHAADIEIRRGDWRGPLHGVPIAIKDCIATAGLRTTANSRVFADWVPYEDAPSVSALRRAGAIVLAKMNLNELAWSIPAEDDLRAPPRNPWSTSHYAMGSSSGSAVAVASGLCPGALGTDAGGSVRQPAANCGIVGLKPTHGVVDSSGALGPPTICEVGPLARSVEDASLLLDALTGGSYAPGLRQPTGHARVGVPRSHVELAHPDAQISAAFAEALDVMRQLGIEIVDVEIAGLADAAAADFIVLNAEAFAAHEEALRTRMGDFGRSARVYQLQGAFLSAADYIVALRVGAAVRDRVNETLSAVDFLATPVVPVLTAEAARAARAQPHTGGTAIFTAPFNLTGHPALAVPGGISSEGIPIGLQLIGRAGGDADLLRLAHAYEQATPWHDMHPPIDAVTNVSRAR